MNDLIMVPWIHLSNGDWIPVNKIAYIATAGNGTYKCRSSHGSDNYIEMSASTYKEFCEIMDKVAKTGLIVIFRKDEEQ